MIDQITTAVQSRLQFRWGVAQVIMVATGLVTAVLTTTTSVIEIREARAKAIEAIENDGIHLIDGVGGLVADAIYVSYVDKVDDLSRALSAQRDIQYVQVFRSTGRLVADTREKEYPTGRVDDELQVAVADGRRTIRQFGTGTLEVSAPIRVGDDVLGGINLGFSTRSVDEQVSSVIRQEIRELLVILSAGLAISYLLGRYFARPLHRLVASARGVGEGNFEPSGLAERNDEIGELASAFDQMTLNLRSFYEELETRVEQRTADLEVAQQKLRALARQLVNVQESERRHLARELHDEIGQELTGLNFLLGARNIRSDGGSQPDAERAREIVGDLISRVRNLSLDLRPSMLDDLGISAALTWLVERYSSEGGVRVDLEYEGPESRLSQEVETTVYRMVQEGLTNVVRHSSATEAAVAVSSQDHTLRILVEDQGVGFDLSSTHAGTSVGIASIRERVESLGGRFSLESTPGKGTRLVADLPIDPEAAH